MKNILITICARGGSKGVPDKNIRLLNDKPIIAYTIQQAFRFQKEMSKDYQVDVVLSTDSEKIKSIAADFGLKTDYTRPDVFATDKAGKVAAIDDVFKFCEQKYKKSYAFVLDLDVTAPLRTLEDLKESLALMEADTAAITLFSVSKPHRNPYFNMVEKKADGYVKLVNQLAENIYARQEAPQVYDMNASFYIYRRIFFEENYTTPMTEKSIAYLMSHICFDVDYMLDLDIMTYLIKEKKLDFNFE